MDWSSIIVAALALIGSLFGTYVSNNKTKSLIAYRIEQLENKVSKHNNLIDRTYHLEEEYALLEEKLKVANHRIEDLEKE